MEYSVLRYSPSLFSGERINLGILFCDAENNIQEFHHTSKWSRIREFDDELDMEILKRFLLSIKEEIAGTLNKFSTLVLEDYIKHYVSEFSFDKPIKVDYDKKEDAIELAKKMFLKFDFEKRHRLTTDEELKYVWTVLKSTGIQVKRNDFVNGKFDEKVVYDYMTEQYGIKMLSFKDKDLSKMYNTIKAWAWNCKENESIIDTVIIYDFDTNDVNLNRTQLKNMIRILESASKHVYPIDEGIAFINNLPKLKTLYKQ